MDVEIGTVTADVTSTRNPNDRRDESDRDRDRDRLPEPERARELAERARRRELRKVAY